MRIADLRWYGLLATAMVAFLALTAKTQDERDQADRAGWVLTLAGVSFILAKSFLKGA